MKAKVSVIIPVYNAQGFIRETLDSVLALQPAADEIIVVDDGSSDATFALVSAYPQVKAIRQANGGDAAARRTGLAASSGEFILFLDHDDLLLPDALVHHLAAMGDDASPDMVFGSNLLIDENSKTMGRNLQQSHRFSGRDVALGTTPSFSACLYRRSALERIGGFRPEARASADIDLNLRLLANRQAGFCHGNLVMQYRLHSGQQTRSPAKLYRQHVAVLESVLGPGGEMEDADLLRAAIRRWKTYYGQFMPSEFARALLRRDWRAARLSAGTFLACLPGSMKGAAAFWTRRLARTGQGSQWGGA